MAFQVFTAFPVPVDRTTDQLSGFLHVPKWLGPKAGLRASTQKLGVVYLPNASLPLAGSRSQLGGFLLFFFFSNSFWAHGLEIARVVSYKIRDLSLPQLLREKTDTAFPEGTLTLNVHGL